MPSSLAWMFSVAWSGRGAGSRGSRPAGRPATGSASAASGGSGRVPRKSSVVGTVTCSSPRFRSKSKSCSVGVDGSHGLDGGRPLRDRPGPLARRAAACRVPSSVAMRAAISSLEPNSSSDRPRPTGRRRAAGGSAHVAVDTGAVGAFQVGQDDVVVVLLNLGVEPADALVVEAEDVALLAADGDGGGRVRGRCGPCRRLPAPERSLSSSTLPPDRLRTPVVRRL